MNPLALAPFKIKKPKVSWFNHVTHSVKTKVKRNQGEGKEDKNIEHDHRHQMTMSEDG